MAIKRLVFKPGVNVEISPSANPGGWSASNAIRWRSAMAEALLGFQAICRQAVAGVARAMHYWADLDGVSRIAIGRRHIVQDSASGTVSFRH